MKENQKIPKTLDEVSVREVLCADLTMLSGNIFVDPAPTMLPLTPVIIGKQVLKGIRHAVTSLKDESPKNK